MSVAIATSKQGNSITQTVALDSGHTMIFDEPAQLGGADEGPSPTEAIGASLAACTASTLRLYAARKEWDLTGLRVIVDTTFERYRPSSFKVRLEFPDGLDESQIERLRQIAGKCPVQRTLAEPIPVEVT